jgi:hypothetical protein
MKLSAPLSLLAVAVALPPLIPAARAQEAKKLTPAAPTASGWAYLDDEAEEAGFDVTASLAKAPVEWALCEQEEGEGYRLKLEPRAATLGLFREGRFTPLARGVLPTLSAATPASAVLQRRGASWRLLLNGRRVLEAEDDTWTEGRIGWKGSADAVKDVRVQPVEEIAFDDDFMRVKSEVALEQARKNPRAGVRIADVKSEETLWRAVSGGWATTGLSENAEAQVAQSMNAFAFKSNKAGANLALAGRPFWSDYSIETAVRPEGAAAVGLATYAQDAGNALLLRWSRAEEGMENSGSLELRSVVAGKTQVLGRVAGGFEDFQWYRMKLSVSGGTLRAFIDDQEVLRVRADVFGRGEAGVYAECATEKQTAMFDDVRVRSVQDFEEDFSRAVPGRWRASAGSWSWSGSAAPTSAQASQATTGQRSWTDYEVAAPIALPADAAAGLLLHQSEDGHYLLRVGGSKSRGGFAGKTQVLKVAGGKTTVLATASTGTRFDGRATTWKVRSEDGYLSAWANGQRVLDAFDVQLREGRAGLWALKSTSAPTFGQFSVSFPLQRPTWAKVPELYVAEQQAETMGGWSTPQGFWLPARPLGANATPISSPSPAPAAPASAAPAGAATTLWHKGTFWGDDRLKFKVPDLKAEQSFAILLDSPDQASGGGGKPLQVSFSLKDSALQASLSRDGQAKPLSAGKLKVEGKATDYTVDLQQKGSFIIARAYKSEDERKTLFAARVR